MYKEISDRLKRFNQEHILKYFPFMTDKEKANLIKEINLIDFEQITALYKAHRLSLTTCEKSGERTLEEADVLFFSSNEASVRYRKSLYCLGEDCLSQGRVAIFLVAGGQGTRLGFKGPKGSYAISAIKNKSLFQLFSESILFLQRRYGTRISWYIMTSHENNEQTQNFFKDNYCFGLKKENIHFLIQKQIPSLDVDGKLVITRNKTIFKNPNGHGGAIIALNDSGALQEMESAGIEEIFYFQVDNPLVKIADPLFVGAHVEHNAEMSSKVVSKLNAAEKVGIIGKVDGRLGCIEYCELSEKQASEKKSSGSLRFNSANIAIHMVNRNFVEKLCKQEDFSLPYHTAVKEIESLDVDDNGFAHKTIEGIKFEMFIFDALGFAERVVTLEVSRGSEFSPVKNKTGTDSSETARSAMIELHTKWLKSSKKAASIPENFVVEVSPLFAMDEETFRDKFVPPSHIPSQLYVE